MKKNCNKFILCFVCICLCVFVFSTSFASQTSSAVQAINSGTGTYARIREIMQILFWLGAALTLFKAMHIGVKFISSPAQKGDAKEAIIPWAVGAVLLATAGVVAPWIIDIIEPNGGSTDIFNLQ